MSGLVYAHARQLQKSHPSPVDRRAAVVLGNSRTSRVEGGFWNLIGGEIAVSCAP